MPTNSYKPLGQLNPSAATLTTAYTVPASPVTAIVSLVKVCNRSATGTYFRIAHRPTGTAISNEMYLYYDQPIGGNETIEVPGPITMSFTDKLDVYATLATLSFTVNGVEITP